jgi:hypothetical protein
VSTAIHIIEVLFLGACLILFLALLWDVFFHKAPWERKPDLGPCPCGFCTGHICFRCGNPAPEICATYYGYPVKPCVCPQGPKLAKDESERVQAINDAAEEFNRRK